MADQPKAVLTPRFTQALEYARVLFAGDVRKGTDIAYLSHLLAVAALVLEHGGDEDQAIAAILHDAGEDKGGCPRIESIRADFGDEVAQIVEACSDSLKPEGEAKDDWWERKVTYLDHLGAGPAALVSAADKLHNARAVLADYRVDGDKVFGRFKGKRSGTLWYYKRLAEIVPGVLDPSAQGLGNELHRTVDQLCDAAHLSADEYAQACNHERKARAAS